MKFIIDNYFEEKGLFFQRIVINEVANANGENMIQIYVVNGIVEVSTKISI